MVTHKRDYKLTGRTRLRVTQWTQKLVLQVEWQDKFHTHLFAWRDATIADVQELGVRESVAAATTEFSV